MPITVDIKTIAQAFITLELEPIDTVSERNVIESRAKLLVSLHPDKNSSNSIAKFQENFPLINPATSTLKDYLIGKIAGNPQHDLIHNQIKSVYNQLKSVNSNGVLPRIISVNSILENFNQQLEIQRAMLYLAIDDAFVAFQKIFSTFKFGLPFGLEEVRQIVLPNNIELEEFGAYSQHSIFEQCAPIFRLRINGCLMAVKAFFVRAAETAAVYQHVITLDNQLKLDGLNNKEAHQLRNLENFLDLYRNIELACNNFLSSGSTHKKF